MRGADVCAVAQILRADDGEHDALAAVVDIDPVAGSQLHALLVRLEAARLGKLDAVIDAKALRLAAVEKPFVIFAVCVHRLLLFGAETVIAVLRRIEKLFGKFIAFVFHVVSSP